MCRCLCFGCLALFSAIRSIRYGSRSGHYTYSRYFTAHCTCSRNRISSPAFREECQGFFFLISRFSIASASSCLSRLSSSSCGLCRPFPGNASEPFAVNSRFRRCNEFGLIPSSGAAPSASYSPLTTTLTAFSVNCRSYLFRHFSVSISGLPLHEITGFSPCLRRRVRPASIR